LSSGIQLGGFQVDKKHLNGINGQRRELARRHQLAHRRLLLYWRQALEARACQV